MKKTSYAYIYDGSFCGLLNCAYNALKNDEIPLDILFESASLIPAITINSDEAIAQKMISGIKSRISQDAYNAVRILYLSAAQNKELILINFLEIAFKIGKKVMEMLSNPQVFPFLAAIKQVRLEAQRFIQFIRFSDYKGSLVAQIEPQNNVLPLLVHHFTQRFPTINFMIYDASNSLALIYENSKSRIIPLEDFTLPDCDENEQKYRDLWKDFYETIAIKQRKNEQCRRNHMPKKYWKNMTELM